MERLTKRTSGGAANLDYPEKCHCTDRVKGLIAMSAYRQKAFERLAAYEDTGLEPEAVERIKLSFMGKSIAEITEFEGVPIARLRELAQAEKDGRLVELPCKVGSIVYAITSPDNVDGLKNEEAVDIFECTVESVTFYSNGNAQFRLYYHGVFVASFVTADDFGKTVFLTREEAEAALKKREEANNETD